MKTERFVGYVVGCVLACFAVSCASYHLPPGTVVHAVAPSGDSDSPIVIGSRKRDSVPSAVMVAPGGGANPNAPKPYAQVIPAKAKTRRGLFVTHIVGEKLYFEIPKASLNTELLLVGRYARAAAGTPGMYGGDEFSERTIRWERSGDRVFLRGVSYTTVADSGSSIARAVVSSSYAPIIAIFPVESYGPDSAAVIDVTRLYTTSVPEFSSLSSGLDPARSYVEQVVAFPDNVEVEATQTTMVTPSDPSGDGRSDVRNVTAQSVVAHWSMVRLPRHPMRPRLSDERVGYFGIEQTDYSGPEQQASTRTYIARWRLEKKDPTAAVSDPVQPLVYYVDPATPEEWKPWVRKAILDWQPAFEAAGFSHAIVAADPPPDSDWSPDDVRHTVIRWLPSTTENAMGPHISDPRTGEILNGSIAVYHNVLKLQRSWYFTQVGHLDPRALQFPLPDSLLGRMLEYVVAHEIGHTLGLRHDQLGSSLYPVDSLRSPTWMHTMGVSPSIMDYARFDYVAQPEDRIALGDLIPRIGPYDRFAIRWGYSPVAGARNAQDERLTLDQWARVQDTVPYLRFAEENPAGNYGTATEAVGDADPVKATGWGIKNLARVMQLVPAAGIRPGYDNEDVGELYEGVVQQWLRELRHVITEVGGATVQFKSGSQPGAVYTPLSRLRQQAAVRFVNAQGFQAPVFITDASVARRLEPSGMVERVNEMQARLLASLWSDARMQRLVDYAAVPVGLRDPSARDVYTVNEFMDDVRMGVWSELAASRVRIDPYRRALQASYLTQADEKLHVAPTVSADITSVTRAELVTLRGELTQAVPRAADAITKAHVQSMLSRVKMLLDPRAAQS